MATKVSTKKPSSISLQEQFNELSKAFIGSKFRNMLDQVETEITRSSLPDQAKPKAFSEMVDESLTDMEIVVSMLLSIQKRSDPNVVISELQRRLKK